MTVIALCPADPYVPSVPPTPLPPSLTFSSPVCHSMYEARRSLDSLGMNALASGPPGPLLRNRYTLCDVRDCARGGLLVGVETTAESC